MPTVPQPPSLEGTVGTAPQELQGLSTPAGSGLQTSGLQLPCVEIATGSTLQPLWTTIFQRRVTPEKVPTAHPQQATPQTTHRHRGGTGGEGDQGGDPPTSPHTRGTHQPHPTPKQRGDSEPPHTKGDTDTSTPNPLRGGRPAARAVTAATTANVSSSCKEEEERTAVSGGGSQPIHNGEGPPIS